ncbi:hypothetical protein SDRG_10040 [Saprolegnia diclina VS20]|uniref:PH domain-containing protein n=1 Tax=Saprolegnia diclina (strain VS20) TaxID=1156394 RepID=T0RIU2_SAPDV|nr:hypothetical protein SDRG_10040 [Saprolegnia diclina VS20]EQC32293.1 hypothetical protein SDRG_10040 [Saprolegnia diclina VS20]|eukprot:XP_008614234.1 hypothetical protein SDRG_10040 [Saprolegnia diclina VS20]
MLLTAEDLLAMAAKVGPPTLGAHMQRVRATDAQGTLHPELKRLNDAMEAEATRYALAMQPYDQQRCDHASLSGCLTPLRSPLQRRRGSLVLDMGSLVESKSAASSPKAKPPVQSPHESPSYQSLFLAAALQLLDEKDKPRTSLPPSLDAHHPKLPPDTLLAGYLKKAKDNSLRTSTKKYAVLTRGVLRYYADMAAATYTEIILVPRRFLCRENLSQRFQHKYAFELLATGSAAEKRQTKLVFMAKSETERRLWVHAIRAVVNASPVSPRAIDGDCYAFILLQRQIQDARRKDAYVHALRSATHHELCVPVEWVHSQLQQTRQHLGESGMDQVFKDLGRDRVSINGRVYSGADGTESVVGALAQAFMDVCDDLTEALALDVVRSVLLSCNRTQSGGDTYETVDYLYHNASLVVLCPSAREAAPLEIKVVLRDTCPELAASLASDDLGYVPRQHSLVLPTKVEQHRPSMASAISFGDDLDSSFLPAKALNLFAREKESVELVSFAGEKMHVAIVAATSYKICDANPQGDASLDTWAIVDAVFEQSFVYAPTYGVLEGKGTVRVATRSVCAT